MLIYANENLKYRLILHVNSNQPTSIKSINKKHICNHKNPKFYNTSFTQSTVAVKLMVFNTSLKLFNVWDSFKEDGIVRHIFAPRKRAFSIPYPVVLGFGAKIFLLLRRVYGVSFSSKILFMKLGLRFF